ncbi:MAG TPA: PadR family transcriptional regulator [Solirubrobacteraceae bacterium]|nr:PadR family transcriptional regulator [Solirubrobacteraceae bacterium]
MKSPVNWALLGLIIERESYAYELAGRFQSTYRDALSLSSTSHIYTALSVLEKRSLVEPVPGTASGRQPKPNYRATPRGLESYADWLVDYVREDRRRQVLFVLGLSALASNPAWVTEILDRYERAWLSPEDFEVDGLPAAPGAQLILRSLSEEKELTVAAKLSWARHVRGALEERQELVTPRMEWEDSRDD